MNLFVENIKWTGLCESLYSSLLNFGIKLHARSRSQFLFHADLSSTFAYYDSYGRKPSFARSLFFVVRNNRL